MYIQSKGASMTTAVLSRWGNANALRIPLPFCKQLGLSAGSSVELTIEDDRLIVKASDDAYTLTGRMKDWDGKRFQSEELDWGEAVGDELW